MRRSRLTILLGATALGLSMLTVPAQAATSKYTLVTEPADNYQAIYSLITSATTSLDMTMYELTDTTAEQDLAADASRGVTVRVILDVNREKSNNQAAFSYLAAHGVQVVWAQTKYAATHQKTITVDGKTSAIMSGNLTSQYYATSRDFAVLDTNLVDIAAIEKVFNADFAGTAITPTDGDNLVWSPTDSQTKLINLINSATSTLSVENEEMADTAVTNALVAAAKRGVTVQVTMTANSSYDSAFNQLVAAGAKVHLYAQTASLYIHAKVIDVDAALAAHRDYVGSINFSDYSLNQNRELGFISSDSGIDTGLNTALASDFAGGTNYTG
ncbi:MAG: phospholipase D-like domain-containing protein [Actinomycetota bacterium]|nr:phospholipase D-like domain-containing protein [Actinomycetota bacterium]MDQ2957547.1 phospholipase D-like domain-containing protein [Actinomycetota bacterium]